jgi:integrase/recombinase XerD
MSALSAELDRYLAIRRSLGHDLRTAERILRRFVGFAEAEGEDHVSTTLFTRWQAAFGAAGRQTWAARLRMVRLFAQWLHGLDPRHEVPPPDLLPHCSRRQRPFIYSQDQIRRIVEAAAELPSQNGIRSLTYPILFGLIAVTGLRVSEALSLGVGDIDLRAGVITVLHGKFGKERLVPVAETTRLRLRDYASERDRLLGRRPPTFFVSDKGDPLTGCAARYNFAHVCQAIGLREPQRFNRHGRGPRIHDLRHSFAVHTLIGWYRTGQDPDREMIKLTTYLGHSTPAHTYWYIEAVPELLELASRRAETSLGEEVRP